MYLRRRRVDTTPSALVGRGFLAIRDGTRHDRSVRSTHVLGIGLALVLAGCGGEAPPRRDRPLIVGRDMPVPEASAKVIRFAEAQVGKRYCWGGTGPNCFDCSGLVQAAWRAGGVRLPRTSGAQGRALREVPISEVQPGDILWWPHHVGLYVGNATMIDAYHSGAGVVRRPAAMPKRVLRVR